MYYSQEIYGFDLMIKLLHQYQDLIIFHENYAQGSNKQFILRRIFPIAY